MGRLLKVIQTYKGAPTFSRMIALRVCDNTRDASALIFVSGAMGQGKSTFSLNLAEAIARDIAWIKFKRKGKPEDYFTINNLRTVDRDGGLDILTSEALMKPHSVLILDDGKISADCTKFQTKSNSVIRDIATIMRPFRGVLIINSVSFRHIDKGLRELANYVVHIVGTNTTTKETLSKVYKFESGEYGDMKKFLTCSNSRGEKMRMVLYTSGLPSKKIMKEYQKMRIDNSIELVKQTRDRFLAGEFQTGSGKIEKVDPRIAKVNALVEEHGDKIRELYSSGMKRTAIERKLNLTTKTISTALVGMI